MIIALAEKYIQLYSMGLHRTSRMFLISGVHQGNTHNINTNYPPEQLVQRPSSPATLANVKSVGKDLGSIAISINFHTCLKRNVVIGYQRHNNTINWKSNNLKYNYLKGVIFHKWYVLFINQCVFCLERENASTLAQLTNRIHNFSRTKGCKRRFEPASQNQCLQMHIRKLIMLTKLQIGQSWKQ